MLRHYFIIAFRALLRSKTHSFINITGLTLGIACCLLISLFVYDEWTFDTFHTKSDRIYRAFVSENWGEGQEFLNTVTPFPLGPALKENFEEIEDMVRITGISSQIRSEDQLFTQSVIVTGQSFLNMFDFPAVDGDRDKALTSLNGVVLSERAAERFFGKKDAAGETLSMRITEAFEDFEVKAVLKDAPTNSSHQFDVIISDLNFPRLYSQQVLNQQWFNVSPETYVLLREGADPVALKEKFPALFRTRLGNATYEESKFEVGLQPLTAIHLDTSLPEGMVAVSNPKYAYILATVSVLILCIACINFVTLSIGKSLRRAKEVGVRKVAGAHRRQLIAQFVGEAVIVTMASLVLGLVAAQLVTPIFNELSGKNLQLQMTGFTIVVAITLVGVIGCLAGSYPAFVLSSFKPALILKGSITGVNNRQHIRKVLVGIQLVLSCFLITSTLIMSNQLSFLQSKNLGYEKTQLISVPMNIDTQGSLSVRIDAGFNKGERLKQVLSQISGVEGICISSHDFGAGQWTNLGYTDDKGIYRTFFMNIIEPGYLDVLDIAIAEGRNFDEKNPSDRISGVIINEAFAKSLGWEYPFDKKIPGKNFPDHNIIGVVKDFHFASLYTPIAPLAMVINPTILHKGSENINIENSPMPKLFIRLAPGDMPATVQHIKNTYEKVTGGEEFVFRFVDETLNQQYRSDQNLGRIIRKATIIAIIIASMGLYGLASLSIQSKRKEISIRKVLGATEQSLMLMLSRDYIILVIISLLVSVPATMYLMKDWLSSFEYRINITAVEFIAAGAISLLVTFITISYQVLKSAFEKPANTLKYE